jgi:hypothetical protein
MYLTCEHILHIYLNVIITIKHKWYKNFEIRIFFRLLQIPNLNHINIIES